MQSMRVIPVFFNKKSDKKRFITGIPYISISLRKQPRLMENDTSSPDSSGIPVFLKIWQTVEVILLLMAVPLLLAMGMLFTGDSDKTLMVFLHYIIPGVLLLFLLKLIALIAFFRKKRWSFFFSFYESIFWGTVFGMLVILEIIAIFTQKEQTFTFLSGITAAIPMILLSAFKFFLAKQYNTLLHTEEEE